jgi:hypothetical protein
MISIGFVLGRGAPGMAAAAAKLPPAADFAGLFTID